LQATQAGLVQRVLFITGYDLRPEKTQMLGPVLGKPFKGKELIAAVRAVMGETSPH
jgi:DNA-binding response OmpR family regulator